MLVTKPKLFIINYADDRFRIQQKWNTRTAKVVCAPDNVIEYGPSDISEEFISAHKSLWESKRGGGYWIWKAYIILDQLQKMEIGDVLFYSDSGLLFLGSLRPLFKYFDMLEQPILGFELPLLEKQWSKKYLCNTIGVDEKNWEGNQIAATYFLVKKTEESLAFFYEYAELLKDPKNVNDELTDVENDSSFIEHRHDQSVFSLLFKHRGYKPIRDISDYGIFPEFFFGDERMVALPYSSEVKHRNILLSYKTNSMVPYFRKYLKRLFYKKCWRKKYDKKYDSRGISYLIDPKG